MVVPSNEKRPSTLELSRYSSSDGYPKFTEYGCAGGNEEPGYPRPCGSFVWAEHGSKSAETPNDSSLSEDSSYVSAKDSSATSINSQQSNSASRIHFASPLNMMSGPENRSSRTHTDLLVKDRPRSMPLKPLISSKCSRSEYSPQQIKRVTPDYDKIEFFQQF